MNTFPRLVIVEADRLDDLCDLVDRALDQLDSIQPRDALNSALRGALGEVRAHSMLEPVA